MKGEVYVSIVFSSMADPQWQGDTGNSHLRHCDIGSAVLVYVQIFRLQLPQRAFVVIRYLWVLVKEIVKANVSVLKIIFSPELQPEPGFVYFDTDFSTGMAKMLLANSITLTPGTITVSVEGDRFCVHCLDQELAEGVEDSVFVELLKEMEAEKEKWS